MTVGELIKHLQTLPTEMKIVAIHPTEDNQEIQMVEDLSTDNFFVNDGGVLTIDVQGLSFF